MPNENQKIVEGGAKRPKWWPRSENEALEVGRKLSGESSQTKIVRTALCIRAILELPMVMIFMITAFRSLTDGVLSPSILMVYAAAFVASTFPPVMTAKRGLAVEIASWHCRVPLTPQQVEWFHADYPDVPIPFE